MTSEELFNEASRLFPEADHIYASVSTQKAGKDGAPFTSYTIGAGSDAATSKFDIAYGYADDAGTYIANAVADAEARRQKLE